MEVSLIPVAAAGLAGAAAGSMIPMAGERLMEYKASRKAGQYPVYAAGRQWCWAYPLGLAASWMASAMGQPVEGLFFAAVSFLMFVVTYLDNRYRIIPNESCLIVLAAGLVYRLAKDGPVGLAGALAAMLISVAVCLAASILTAGGGGIGAGDVKLMAACCFLAGMPGFLKVLVCMSLALGVYCIYGLKSRMLTLKSTFPMGGFIAMGLVLSFYTAQLEQLNMWIWGA